MQKVNAHELSVIKHQKMTGQAKKVTHESVTKGRWEEVGQETE